MRGAPATQDMTFYSPPVILGVRPRDFHTRAATGHLRAGAAAFDGSAGGGAIGAVRGRRIGLDCGLAVRGGDGGGGPHEAVDPPCWPSGPPAGM